jgi:acyl dehydratase
MSGLARQPVAVGGPWFEELDRGQIFEDAPGLTVTSGHAELHQALVGDRLRLALDTGLCREVTGRDRPLVHPNLVCDVAIGQSTGPATRGGAGPLSRRARGRPTFLVEAGETVTGAPELARLTLNVATAHTDATLSLHGRRLVYGGHTISIAAAHATRAIPAIATIVAWRSCEHIAPVFEGDVLRTEVDVVDSSPDGLVELRARVSSVRPGAEDGLVLDWGFVAVVA